MSADLSARVAAAVTAAYVRDLAGVRVGAPPQVVAGR